MTRQEYNRQYYLDHRVEILVKTVERNKRYMLDPVYRAKKNAYRRKLNKKHPAKNPYKYIWINGKCLPEHRYLMEQFLGRKLSFNEIVHHLDHNPKNNAIENLAIMPRSTHGKHHHPIINSIT